QAAHGLREHRAVVGIENRLYREHLGVIAKRLHGAIDHRLATDLSILLGAAGARAESASSGDENGGGAVRSGHWARYRLFQGNECARRTALTMSAAKKQSDSLMIPARCRKSCFLLQCTCAFHSSV